MQLSSGRNSVTTTPEQIQKLREEVINKQMLIELYVDYFGEDKRARIEEKLGKAYDFVIPIDIPSYNLQKYLLKDPNYSNAKFICQLIFRGFFAKKLLTKIFISKQ